MTPGSPAELGVATVVVEFVTDFVVTSPPTPRTHTPPPGWSGAGLGGAETNALPCCEIKAVLIWLTELTNAALTAEFMAAAASRFWRPVVFGLLVQFAACAKAPEQAEDVKPNATIATAPRLIRPLMPMSPTQK